MIKINIDEKCIRCGKCVKVCPATIFTQQTTKSPIGLQNEQTCIECGHCVAICPTESVLHSQFPSDRIHDIDRGLIPSPGQMMALLKARRSNRAFLSTPIPQNYLDQIVEAAHLAPTASNGQDVSFTLVTNPDLLKQISDYSIQTFESTVKMVTNPLIKPFVGLFAADAKKGIPHLKAVIDKYKSGYDVILREAKAVLFIHTPAKSNFGKQDANLAYQNASLMAESLGVTQFYTGYVCISTELDKKHRLNKLLNIEGEIQAGMALAMPAFKFHKYTDKNDIRLTVL